MRSVAFVASVVTVVSLLPAMADTPALIGKWTGMATVAHVGATPHRADDGDGVSFAMEPLPVIFEITEQQTNHFAGLFKIRDVTETIIGSIQVDGKGGIMLDDDGQWFFTLAGADEMDLCYFHAAPTNKVVGCFPVRRVR